MGRLTNSDENLHYSDGSHRWIAPPNVSQDLWDAVVRRHVAAHTEASHVEEIARPSPRNAYQRGTVCNPPSLVQPEPPATPNMRKPRPRSQVGARRSTTPR